MIRQRNASNFRMLAHLAEQAGFNISNDPIDGHDFKIISSYEIKKFAKLIVKECSKVIVNGGYRNPALGKKHPLTPPEIATMIRKHFGINK